MTEHGWFDPEAGLELVAQQTAIYHTLLGRILASFGDLPAQTEVLLKGSGRPALIRLYHNLKATTGQAGSERLSAHADRLVSRLRQDGSDPGHSIDADLLEDILAFNADFDHLLAAIRAYLATEAADGFLD
jgi:HPt (histidine-containing phosphotransfer) domain-containing protein